MKFLNNNPALEIKPDLYEPFTVKSAQDRNKEEFGNYNGQTLWPLASGSVTGRLLQTVAWAFKYVASWIQKESLIVRFPQDTENTRSHTIVTQTQSNAVQLIRIQPKIIHDGLAFFIGSTPLGTVCVVNVKNKYRLRTFFPSPLIMGNLRASSSVTVLRALSKMHFVSVMGKN